MKLLKNKFFIAGSLFLIWILFFDQHNILERFSNIHKYNQLQKDKVYYKNWIEKDAQRLKELQTDDDNLEKFAREQYLMKKKDEDIFIIIEED